MQTFSEQTEKLPEAIKCDMRSYRSRPVLKSAVKMYGAFRIKSSDGSYTYGQPGDYIVQCEDGVVKVVDSTSFERQFVRDENKEKIIE